MSISAAQESESRAGVPRRRVPDFFIVGHFKCGTTAMHRMLGQHPQIYFPSEVKELWFFTPEFRPQAASGRHPLTLEDYLAMFKRARPDQRAGDNSPSYLLSEHAAARIAELQPDARIIAIFREPASFLRSFHLQAVRHHFEPEGDLRKALALEPERREGRNLPPEWAWRPHELFYSEHVRYAEQLRRFHAVFPPEQVLALIYEEFRADNAATLRRVLDFLDVDAEVAASQIEIADANPSVRVRSLRSYELLRTLYMGRGPVAQAVKSSVKALTPRRLRRGTLRTVQRRFLYGKPRPPDEALMLELRRGFKGEVEAFSDYLGRDLVGLWGYERLD